MRAWFSSLLAVCCVLSLSCGSAKPSPGAPADAGGAPVALGAFILDRDAPVAGYAPFDLAAMPNYAAMVGGKPTIIMWYRKHPDGFPRDDAESVAAFGANPMITLELCKRDPNAGGVCALGPQPEYTNQAIVLGNHDAYFKAFAEAAKAWGKPFFLRFHHEMNGFWYPWSTGPKNANQNTHEDYVAAWRHVHAIFDAAGATNASWVWSPNVGYPLAADYPGDAFVDWIALDGYNWGTLSPQTAWVSFKDLFGPSYAEIITVTQKPLMFAEAASAPLGGDKAAWITQGFLNDLPVAFPRVRAVIWFDMKKETDWRVNSSDDSLTAWKSVVQSPRFQAGPLL